MKLLDRIRAAICSHTDVELYPPITVYDGLRICRRCHKQVFAKVWTSPKSWDEPIWLCYNPAGKPLPGEPAPVFDVARRTEQLLGISMRGAIEWGFTLWAVHPPAPVEPDPDETRKHLTPPAWRAPTPRP